MHRADVYINSATTECFNYLFKECELDLLAYLYKFC